MSSQPKTDSSDPAGLVGKQAALCEQGRRPLFFFVLNQQYYVLFSGSSERSKRTFWTADLLRFLSLALLIVVGRETTDPEGKPISISFPLSLLLTKASADPRTNKFSSAKRSC